METSEMSTKTIALRILAKRSNPRMILLMALTKLNKSVASRFINLSLSSSSKTNSSRPRNMKTTICWKRELSCIDTSLLHRRDLSRARGNRKVTIESDSDESGPDDSEDSDYSNDDDEKEDDDDDEVDFPPETDQRFPKSYTDKLVYGVRADQIIAGCLTKRSVVVKMLYEGKLRMNNQTLLKKATKVKENDVFDIVHKDEDTKLLISTVKVLKVTDEKTKSGKHKVAVRFWKKPYYIDKTSKS